MTLERSIQLLKVSILGVILLFEAFVIYRYFQSDLEENQVSAHAIISIDSVITVKLSEQIMSAITKKEQEGKLESLLVVLDTPGGSPVASDNLYSFFKKLSKKIPLYMYVNSAAASGGYYIAVASDTIYANKNALVGSVGVVLQNFSFAKMAEELGVEDSTISAGEFKYLLSPIKKTDKATKEYFQEYLLNPVYRNFAATVAKERHISPEDENRFFQGRIFIAGDPRIEGILVDKILSYPEMLEKIRQEQDTNSLSRLEYKPKMSGFISQLLESVTHYDMGLQFK